MNAHLFEREGKPNPIITILSLPLIFLIVINTHLLHEEQASWAGSLLGELQPSDALIIKFLDADGLRFGGLRQGNLITIYTRAPGGRHLDGWELYVMLRHELWESGAPGAVHSWSEVVNNAIHETITPNTERLHPQVSPVLRV